MKIIITEEQYESIFKNPRLWIRRNYKLVKDGLIETLDFVDPCKFETYERYESFFLAVFMDELHPHYYLIDNFDYLGVQSELKDLFYVDTTEAYFEGKEKC